MTKTFIIKVTSSEDDIESATDFQEWLDNVDEMGWSYEVTEQKTP